MKSVIIRPKTQMLLQYVQYFLFFKKTNFDFLNYTTFPNNNLCLAIYKENNVSYANKNGNNSCIIDRGTINFSIKFYGFHKIPFNVDINSQLDQICIVFRPSALRAFTREGFDDLMLSDHFLDIFEIGDTCALEQIFEENQFSRRAEMLEHLLLCNLRFEIPFKLKEALHFISRYNDGSLTVEALAKLLEISRPTLFRLFKDHLGQSPKSYLQTTRFRNVLSEILVKQQTLTSIAHLNQYYDQAHFINDFKTFSGYSPKQLYEKATVQQDDLAWIYNRK